MMETSSVARFVPFPHDAPLPRPGEKNVGPEQSRPVRDNRGVRMRDCGNSSRWSSHFQPHDRRIDQASRRGVPEFNRDAGDVAHVPFIRH